MVIQRMREAGLKKMVPGSNSSIMRRSRRRNYIAFWLLCASPLFITALVQASTLQQRDIADGPNTTPTISEGKGRKSGGGLKPQVWAPVMSAAILVLLAMAGLAFYLIQKWCLHNSSLSFWYGGDDSSTFGQGLVANGQGGYASSKSRSPVQNAKLPHHGPPVKIFTLEELSTAAANFSAEALIGRGGFGAVYIGKLSDGTPIAVKRLSGLSMQGEAEFRTEVGMIAHQLYSPHLVRLLGYSSQGDERILCYELMTRGSLLDYLKDGTYTIPLAVLDWRTRIQIARDAAAGLRFLHESDPPVVHRDVKPNNILLDECYNAKVADFGLSKLYPDSRSSHVTTRVVGTFGYLAPDYSITGRLTVKSDVYSFGVVLLEILSGRSSTVSDEENKEPFLVPWAKPLLNNKKRVMDVVDPVLEGAHPAKGAEMVGSLISSCLQLDPDRRPNMNTVHNILSLVYDIPFNSVKAKLQREALLSKKHSFQVVQQIQSSSASSSGLNNPQFSIPRGKSSILRDRDTKTYEEMEQQPSSVVTVQASPSISETFRQHRRTVSFELDEQQQQTSSARQHSA
ncbi:unnamed protein product [Sphagnum compactum]